MILLCPVQVPLNSSLFLFLFFVVNEFVSVHRHYITNDGLYFIDCIASLYQMCFKVYKLVIDNLTIAFITGMSDAFAFYESYKDEYAMCTDCMQILKCGFRFDERFDI